jgi:predicted dehydrogenase
MQLTVGVLGTGRMARLHCVALNALEKQGLLIEGERHHVNVALYGRDPAKLEALAREVNPVRTTTDLNALIDDPSVQVIDNCLVNRLHYEPLLRAIQRGKHVFTDKPLANTAQEAEELWQAAQRAGVHHGIVQNMRFQAGPAKAKELLDAGVLGRMFHARVVFGYFVPQRVDNRPPWFYQKSEAGGGIVHDMMAHFFDLLPWLLNTAIQSVSCDMLTAFPERETPEGVRFPVEVEDAAVVQVRFANGALGDIFLSWVRRKHEEVPFCEIDGEEGSLIFSFNDLRQQLQSRTPGFRYDPTRPQADPLAGWESVSLQPADPFAVQLGAFLRGILTGKPVKPDWEDATRTLHLVEAAYESAATGRRVVL